MNKETKKQEVKKLVVKKKVVKKSGINNGAPTLDFTTPTLTWTIMI